MDKENRNILGGDNINNKKKMLQKIFQMVACMDATPQPSEILSLTMKINLRTLNVNLHDISRYWCNLDRLSYSL